AIGIYGLATLYYQGWIQCNERTSGQVVSPDGQYVARVWERDCGAAATYNTQVHIAWVQHGNDLSWDTVFRCNAPLEWVMARWQSDTVLVVQVKGPSQVGRRLNEWRNVRIVYDTDPSMN